MKIVSSRPEITFDDVLLLPGRSDFPIEKESDQISLKTRVSKNISLDIPIVSAPMPGVTEINMALALGKAGGMGFIHFFQDFERQLAQVEKVKKKKVKVAAAVSDLSKHGGKHVGNLLKAGADLISVETYHAQNKQLIEFIKNLKNTYRGVEICAGYLVTTDGTEEVIKAGADCIRVGIGGGSHCTTRLVTGVGRPQLSAVADCYKATKKYSIPLLSDTGIKHAGDIPKALAFGADTVMIGGLFTGTDESPGEIIKRAGEKYKYTLGMCTDTAIKQKHLNRPSALPDIKLRLKNYLRGVLGYEKVRQEEKLFEEGVESLVPYKGSVKPIIKQLIDGTKRSMWYQGAKNIPQLQKKARVVLISSHAHLENIPRI